VRGEFIPYDRALKLKHIGFNKPCPSRWIEKSSRDGGGIELEIWNDENTVYEVKSSIGAPLFQQAFRWFREQGFLIHFSSHDPNRHDFFINWSPEKSVLSDVWDTYEGMELACLDKLIEIMETKQLEP
jgi:hypothetical protein